MPKIVLLDSSALSDRFDPNCYITIACLRSYGKNVAKDAQILEAACLFILKPKYQQ